MMTNRVLSAQEVQELHRRLRAASEAGREPSPEDQALRDGLAASPFAEFDRPWAPDDK